MPGTGLGRVRAHGPHPCRLLDGSVPADAARPESAFFVPAGITTLMIFVTMEDLVFHMLASGSRCAALVRRGTTAVPLMAVARAFAPAHVFRPFAAATRVTAAMGIGSMVIVLRMRIVTEVGTLTIYDAEGPDLTTPSFQRTPESSDSVRRGRRR